MCRKRVDKNETKTKVYRTGAQLSNRYCKYFCSFKTCRNRSCTFAERPEPDELNARERETKSSPFLTPETGLDHPTRLQIFSSNLWRAAGTESAGATPLQPPPAALSILTNPANRRRRKQLVLHHHCYQTLQQRRRRQVQAVQQQLQRPWNNWCCIITAIRRCNDDKFKQYKNNYSGHGQCSSLLIGATAEDMQCVLNDTNPEEHWRNARGKRAGDEGSVFIHLFGDGNGRFARLVMNWILVRHGLKAIELPEAFRTEYYQCMRTGMSMGPSPWQFSTKFNKSSHAPVSIYKRVDSNLHFSFLTCTENCFVPADGLAKLANKILPVNFKLPRIVLAFLIDFERLRFEYRAFDISWQEHSMVGGAAEFGINTGCVLVGAVTLGISTWFNGGIKAPLHDAVLNFASSVARVSLALTNLGQQAKRISGYKNYRNVRAHRKVSVPIRVMNEIYRGMPGRGSYDAVDYNCSHTGLTNSSTKLFGVFCILVDLCELRRMVYCMCLWVFGVLH
uniref:Fido domain-containing protein n=1 Tax=Globodera rostochiensis TaxID=31243 RepID=A0A914H7Q1_GLORO